MEARKYSKKRAAILEALRSTDEHPSAEMLYTRLTSEFPDLSLGTVYRNLAMFVADGDVISVGTVAGQERYDADTAPHAHFICSHCGRVLDVSSPNLEGIERQVERQVGGVVISSSLSFTGKCARCLKLTASGDSGTRAANQ